MRKYDTCAIEKLQKGTSIIENNGISVILKPSPGEEKPGYLDPIELSLMGDHWAGKSNGEDPAEMPPMEVLIPIMRENMGFPNYNLNTVEIHTKYEE
jgi:acetyl esterase